MLAIPGLFITGTDTGVGKTVVSAMIARQLRSEGVAVGAYKPACSGAEIRDGLPIWEDVETLRVAIGGGFPIDRICPQQFAAPLAPPAAARLENSTVDAGLLREGAHWWEEQCEFLVVEGVGGLLCPLTGSETVADLAIDLGLPLVIVAHAGLGTINHSLLTIEAAQHRRLAIAGFLLNEATETVDESAAAENAAEIARRSGACYLGRLRHAAPGELHRIETESPIHWRAMARSNDGA